MIVDINGYYSDQGSFHAGRDADAGRRHPAGHPALGSRQDGPVPADSIRQINLPCPVAARHDAAVALNVTAVAPPARGYLTVFPGPCGTGNLPERVEPELHAGPGRAELRRGEGAQQRLICVYTSPRRNLIVDLNGRSTARAPR